jgi:hypothetical protein
MNAFNPRRFDRNYVPVITFNHKDRNVFQHYKLDRRNRKTTERSYVHAKVLIYRKVREWMLRGFQNMSSRSTIMWKIPSSVKTSLRNLLMGTGKG